MSRGALPISHQRSAAEFGIRFGLIFCHRAKIKMASHRILSQHDRMREAFSLDGQTYKDRRSAALVEWQILAN
jgi:hypothetical protein